MKSFLLLPVGSVALSLLAACGPQKPSTVGETPAPSPAWNVKLELPGEVPSGKPVEAVVRVTDSGGRAVEGAEVIVSLNMTTMNMGQNRSRLSEQSPGVYKGKVVFTMEGPWQAAVQVTREGVTFTQRYPIRVR